MATQVEPKPLSEQDIEDIKRRLANVDPDKINEIYTKCSQLINRLITMVMKQSLDEDEIVEIEHLKRVINLAPLEEIFIRSKDKIWNVREHIMNKNADYFIKKDYRTQIKKDHNQVFIETIVNNIKQRFAVLPADDQAKYWQIATELLRNVAVYKKLVGEK